MRQILINTYLDYVNNYLSISLYSEHNGLTLEQGKALVTLAREVASDEANSIHPDS